MDFPHLAGWAALAVTLGAIVFGAGRRLGREEEAQGRRRGELGEESAFYLRGLNFLLADEPDKAIEEFIKFVRVNSETVEIHLSLGKLFRARGEVGRAIRIHQTLIARPNLSQDHRTAALHALAEDFRQGGFVDRAMDAYRQVLNVDSNHRAALAGLQAMHESEGRWDMALEMLKRLEAVTGVPDPRREAHIHVRMGLEDQRPPSNGVGDAGAMVHFREAIRVFPGCVEARRLLGESLLALGRTREAIETFEALKSTRPSHFFMLMDALRRAYERAGDEEGFFRGMSGSLAALASSPRLVIQWAALLEQRGQWEDAVAVLRSGMANHPRSLAIVSPLILLLARRERWQEALEIARRRMDDLLSVQPVFQCSRCGFKSQDIYWKCPQCHQWDTMEPLL
ncbi:MAG: tetratricopeptide repeat protein [Magnetococcales bacterium]|nr:tetratricopeptide repeat protein [Magnetococcales bacterium]